MGDTRVSRAWSKLSPEGCILALKMVGVNYACFTRFVAGVTNYTFRSAPCVAKVIFACSARFGSGRRRANVVARYARIAVKISSTTFFASPNNINVFSL